MRQQWSYIFLALSHRYTDFKLILQNSIVSIQCEIALRWMSQNLTSEKSTSVQVMAWCHQATSHYLTHCLPRSMLLNGIIRPQWIKEYQGHTCLFHYTWVKSVFPFISQHWDLSVIRNLSFWKTLFSVYTMPWFLMAWWHKKPSHQHPWYWPSWPCILSFWLTLFVFIGTSNKDYLFLCVFLLFTGGDRREERTSVGVLQGQTRGHYPWQPALQYLCIDHDGLTYQLLVSCRTEGLRTGPAEGWKVEQECWPQTSGNLFHPYETGGDLVSWNRKQFHLHFDWKEKISIQFKL